MSTSSSISIELFATKIVNNLVPFVLEGRSIISLDLARIVAGSRYRGEFELRFQRVLDEVLAQPNIIIFMVDQLRFDCLGYNNVDVKTPNLDALQKEGITFNNSYCVKLLYAKFQH